MKSRLFGAVGFVAAFFILSSSLSAHAQLGIVESHDPAISFTPTGNSYLNLMVGLRKYFNSFTSWQLPASPGPQNPISRLEYPWDQTFIAIRGSAEYNSLEVNMEWSGTINVISSPKAQDSDWLDARNPNQKTTFSEAEATPRCWTADFSCNMPVPGFPSMRGVIGYRLSQFKFTNTDGFQYGIYDDETDHYGYYTIPLPGPFIEFSQYYKQIYGGGILQSPLDLAEILGGWRFQPLQLRLQADASYVSGNSHDQHLLRNIFGIIRSEGVGWHVNLSAGLNTGRFRFDLEGDLRGIQTSGQIQTPTQYIDGAKAWSEQKYLGINGTIFF